MPSNCGHGSYRGRGGLSEQRHRRRVVAHDDAVALGRARDLEVQRGEMQRRQLEASIEAQMSAFWDSVGGDSSPSVRWAGPANWPARTIGKAIASAWLISPRRTSCGVISPPGRRCRSRSPPTTATVRDPGNNPDFVRRHSSLPPAHVPAVALTMRLPEFPHPAGRRLHDDHRFVGAAGGFACGESAPWRMPAPRRDRGHCPVGQRPSAGIRARYRSARCTGRC